MQIETLPQLDEVHRKARQAMITRCRDEGLSQADAARKLGISRQALKIYLDRHGMPWRLEEKKRVLTWREPT